MSTSPPVAGQGPTAFAPTQLPDGRHGSIYDDEGQGRTPPGRSGAEQSYVAQVASGAATGTPGRAAVDPFARTEVGAGASIQVPPAPTSAGSPPASDSSSGRPSVPAATATGAPQAAPVAPWAPPSLVGSQPAGERRLSARKSWLFLGGLGVVVLVVVVLVVVLWGAVRVRRLAAPSPPVVEASSPDQAVLDDWGERQLVDRLRRAGWSVVDEAIQRTDSEYVWVLQVPVRHGAHGAGNVTLARLAEPAMARSMAERIRELQPAAAVRLERRMVLAVTVPGNPRAARRLRDDLVR